MPKGVPLFFMSILSKFLNKSGVDNEDQLTKEERNVYDNYKKILEGPEKLTIESLKEFCEQQVSIIENRWRATDGDEYKKGDLIPYHTCYKVIIQAIDAPQVERAQLEKYLNGLLNK